MIGETVASCRVLRATGKGFAGAELFLVPEEGAAPSAGEKRLVLRLGASRLLDRDDLLRFLHHELEHVADMLDPSFGYRPELPEVDGGPIRLRIIVERYRVLWGTSIDGRLCQRGQAPASDAHRGRR